MEIPVARLESNKGRTFDITGLWTLSLSWTMQTGKYKLDYYLASPIHHLYVMAMAVTDSLMIKPHQKPKKTAQNSGTESTF